MAYRTGPDDSGRTGEHQQWAIEAGCAQQKKMMLYAGFVHPGSAVLCIYMLYCVIGSYWVEGEDILVRTDIAQSYFPRFLWTVENLQKSTNFAKKWSGESFVNCLASLGGSEVTEKY